ncbi:AI-2E family transporter [Aeromicrobium massiliense]|uniref:AI-2E family transporter n=1 Tax=Aeromicrobium massiliense TaxID=1464554 RepID=UPI0002D49CFF|nr:AI-2E family transporter [Aeromicrobium massiliense]
MSERRDAGRPTFPRGMEIATGWAWRLLLLGVATYALLWVLNFFSAITVPIAVALLLTALTSGLVDRLQGWRVPRSVGTLAVVLGFLAVVTGLVLVVGTQVSRQFDDLRRRVVDGIADLQDWLQTGPLRLTDAQLQRYIDTAQEKIAQADGVLFTTAGEVGVTVSHFVAGLFVVLFATIFFLYDGKRIWAWIVLLFPRSSRDRVHSSGETAWHSLTAFVRATIVVALVDAIGIALAASLLNVPLALAIGVLVFLGAFVPIIGAFTSGLVAVGIALVAQGPWTALFMLIAVLAVQQIESHVLQPFVMGRIVSVHPLGVILAIVAGITVGGVVGALVAVPIAACLNGVVRHLATDEGERFASDGLPADEQHPPVEPAPEQA